MPSSDIIYSSIDEVFDNEFDDPEFCVFVIEKFIKRIKKITTPPIFNILKVFIDFI